MVDVIKFNSSIIHPSAIREVYLIDGSAKVVLMTDASHHEKEFDSEEQALAAVNKIADYLNIVEVI